MTSKTKALAYYRTSSAANVDGDSEARQRAAVQAYAKANGVEIVEEFYDAAVSGADPIDARPGFAAMLERIASNGVKTIVVETASRFARDLIIQEAGFKFLNDLGITIVAADSPITFVNDTPSAVLIRQILGAVSQFEKAALVARLAAARKRSGHVGGQVGLRVSRPDHVRRALALHVAEPDLTLRGLASKLAGEGMTTPSGKPYGPEAIRRMLASEDNA